MGTDDFLWTCKELYFKDVHPFDLDKKNSDSYQRIERIGKGLIKDRGLQIFLDLLMESQYRVNFWAAKCGLEFGNLNPQEQLEITGRKTILDECLATVERHVYFQTTAVQQKNGLAWIKKIKTRYNIV